MAKEDSSGSLMSPAEMKPLLMLSKRDPVSAVIGLTKAKDGVVFLAKKIRPRKLMAQTKKRAADAKLELEVTSLRFGRAAVDTAVDSALGHRQLGGWLACGLRLSQVAGRDDDTCLPELRRLPLPG